MPIVAALFGIGLIAVVLWECFETIVLPRRVTRRFRLTRLFYRRLATYFQVGIPPWTPAAGRPDNWQGAIKEHF